MVWSKKVSRVRKTSHCGSVAPQACQALLEGRLLPLGTMPSKKPQGLSLIGPSVAESHNTRGVPLSRITHLSCQTVDKRSGEISQDEMTMASKDDAHPSAKMREA